MQKENTEARAESQAGDTRVNRSCVWLLYCMISAVAELILIGCKIAGRVAWSWPAVLLSYFWISIAVMAAFTLLAVGTHIFCRAMRQHNERKRRHKIARVLWDAMHGLTLNSIGPIYGVSRKPGEPNKEYESRILKAARTVDKVNLVAPLEAPYTPATGLKLDAIAAKHGLERQPGESDEALQERIRTAVIEKLERRTKNGV